VIKMKEHVNHSGQSSAVIDISSWLAHTTLDAIGISKEILPYTPDRA
jgi:hypothetical protein